MTSRPSFIIGQYVLHEDKLCQIIEEKIFSLNVGSQFREYVIQDMNDGQFITAAMCKLYEVDVDEIEVRLSQISQDFEEPLQAAESDVQSEDDTDAHDEEVVVSEEPESKKSRFVELDSDEVANLARNRVSENTTKKTIWAVKIFKGKTNANTFYSLSFAKYMFRGM